MAFLSDIDTQLKAFARVNQVAAQDVRVRLTLGDGGSIMVRGLQTTDTPTVNGWGMIQGLEPPDSTAEALVIREGHVIKAEFQLRPVESKQIGFQSETTQ